MDMPPTNPNGYATNESNIDVFTTLTEGFKNKFGQPEYATNEKVTNQLGTEFDNPQVAWLDEKDNVLILKLRHNHLKKGMLLLRSAKAVEDAIEHSKKEEKTRRY
jgi:hypothetical protein